MEYIERRQFLRMMAAGAAGLVVPQGCAAAEKAKKTGGQKPNILLIVSEDNGPDLGCYGNSHVKTPNLDKLAAAGVRFENAFTTQASCSPSRSSIFTGLYPHQNGQIGLATHRYSMHREYPTIPTMLKKQGYRTGIIGKLHVKPKTAFEFDFTRMRLQEGYFDNRDVRQVARLAGSFFAKSTKPFFLMVNYTDAHHPFIRQQAGLPEKPLEAEDVEVPGFVRINTSEMREVAADYYNCISRLDIGIGMLLETLKNAGYADDTLVIYVGDHGADLPRGKTTVYESGLRVPFIVRWPGKTKKGLVRNEMVSTIDILPTILEAVSAEIPKGIAGMSILPLIEGKSARWREYIFGEHNAHSKAIYFPQRSVRDHRYKLIVNLLHERPNPSMPAQWNDIKGLKLTETTFAGMDKKISGAYKTFCNPPAEELYDLKEDLYEMNNLAGRPEYAAIQKRLRKQLQKWQKETNDPLANASTLAKLTEEHDQLKKTDGFKPGFKWKYHEYFEYK